MLKVLLHQFVQTLSVLGLLVAIAFTTLPSITNGYDASDIYLKPNESRSEPRYQTPDEWNVIMTMPPTPSEMFGGLPEGWCDIGTVEYIVVQTRDVSKLVTKSSVADELGFSEEDLLQNRKYGYSEEQGGSTTSSFYLCRSDENTPEVNEDSEDLPPPEVIQDEQQDPTETEEQPVIVEQSGEANFDSNNPQTPLENLHSDDASVSSQDHDSTDAIEVEAVQVDDHFEEGQQYNNSAEQQEPEDVEAQEEETASEPEPDLPQVTEPEPVKQPTFFQRIRNFFSRWF